VPASSSLVNTVETSIASGQDLRQLRARFHEVGVVVPLGANLSCHKAVTAATTKTPTEAAANCVDNDAKDGPFVCLLAPGEEELAAVPAILDAATPPAFLPGPSASSFSLYVIRMDRNAKRSLRDHDRLAYLIMIIIVVVMMMMIMIMILLLVHHHDHCRHSHCLSPQSSSSSASQSPHSHSEAIDKG
jgi:hypothetical protein